MNDFDQPTLPGFDSTADRDLAMPDTEPESPAWDHYLEPHRVFVKRCCFNLIELNVIGDALGVNILETFGQSPEANKSIKKWYARGIIRTRSSFARQALLDSHLNRLAFKDFVDRMTGGK